MWGCEKWGAGAKALAVVVCAGGIALSAATADAGTHKDEEIGYSLTYPKKWEVMPISKGQNHLVARFRCHREYEHSDAKTNFWTRHRPQLDVVVIPLSDEDTRGAEVKKTADGVEVKTDKRYRDLKEYLDDAWRNEGGFHFSKEEDLTINGVEVVEYELTIDKLVSVPKRVYAYAYYAEDAIYGVIADALIPHEDKVKKDILAALKSVKLFTRTGTLDGVERTGADVLINDESETKDMTSDQIAERRDEQFDRQRRRIVDALPKDWSVKDTDEFTVISHADSKYTKDVLRHCAVFRSWLDDKLGYIGVGHTGKILIRICASRDEYDAYQDSRGWYGRGFEVVTYKDNEGWLDWNWETLNRGIYDIWMDDKNRSLRYAAPQWIRMGLPDFLENARSKGKKIEFKADTWDNVQVDTLRREDKLLEAHAFFSMTSEQLWSDWNNTTQAQFFIHYLLVGAGSKSSKYKNVFGDYLKNMIFVLDEAEEDDEYAKLVEESPKTEEEETELFRKRQEFWKNKEREFLDQLESRTFEGWSEKNWKKFNASYWKGL